MESVMSVRTVAAPPASLALALDFIRLGIAIAAMIRMMATTISNSMSEKPFCLLIQTLLKGICELAIGCSHNCQIILIRQDQYICHVSHGHVLLLPMGIETFFAKAWPDCKEIFRSINDLRFGKQATAIDNQQIGKANIGSAPERTTVRQGKIRSKNSCR